jgi:hypothetical protein
MSGISHDAGELDQITVVTKTRPELWIKIAKDSKSLV